jgi:hypothetical protein
LLQHRAKHAIEALTHAGLTVGEIVERLQTIQQTIHTRQRQLDEVAPLTDLITNRKKLRRLADAVAGRGPTDRTLLGPVAAYLGVPVEELSKVAHKIPLMYSAGKRRPRQELSTVAILSLSRLFVDTTGLVHHRHVKSIYNAVLGSQLGRVSEAVVRQRVSRQPPPLWLRIPPLHRLRRSTGGSSPLGAAQRDASSRQRPRNRTPMVSDSSST